MLHRVSVPGSGAAHTLLSDGLTSSIVQRGHAATHGLLMCQQRAAALLVKLLVEVAVVHAVLQSAVLVVSCTGH